MSSLQTEGKRKALCLSSPLADVTNTRRSPTQSHLIRGAIKPSSLRIPQNGTADEENLPIPPVKRSKHKKRVKFAASHEIMTFKTDEPAEMKLENVVDRSENGVAVLLPLSPASSRRRQMKTDAREESFEEVIFDDSPEEADQDGLAFCFSLHELQWQTQVVRDTEKMKISELRGELAARKLSTSGRKKDLVRRLENALKEEDQAAACKAG